MPKMQLDVEASDPEPCLCGHDALHDGEGGARWLDIRVKSRIGCMS